jgi:hypothetical protein
MYEASEEQRRLDVALDTWAQWAQAPDGSMSYPNHSAVMQNGTGDAWEVWCDEADKTLAKAVDAILWSMPPAPRAAVHRRYLQAVFRFPRDNYADALLDARQRIAIGLRKRGLWA